MIRARTRARRVARSTTLLKAPAAGVAISQRKLWKRQQRSWVVKITSLKCVVVRGREPG